GEVVALASEHRVRLHMNGDVQVARRAAALPGRALGLEPDALPVRDPGRDAHLHRPGGGGPAAAVADLAGVVHDQAPALAVAARLGEREGAALAVADVPGADAGRADPGRRPGLGAGAGARLARGLAGHPQRHGRAVDRLQETQRHLGLDVRAATGAGRRTAAVEQAAEEVAHPAEPAGLRGRATAAEEVAEVEAAGAARAGTEAAVGEERAGLVVLLAPLGVGEHVVGLGDLLEALLGLAVALVGIRVELAGELAVRLLDLGGGGVLGHPEDLVVVLLHIVLGAHRSLLLSAAGANEPFTPCAGRPGARRPPTAPRSLLLVTVALGVRLGIRLRGGRAPGLRLRDRHHRDPDGPV